MTMPPSIEQQVTFLYTPDLAATARFYEDIMGLDLVLDQGTCRIYRVSHDAFIGFCERADPVQPQGIIFTLVTQAVDQWYDHLLAQGISFEKTPQVSTKFNIYQCWFRDPNGYLIEIQQFLDPAWPAP